MEGKEENDSCKNQSKTTHELPPAFKNIYNSYDAFFDSSKEVVVLRNVFNEIREKNDSEFQWTERDIINATTIVDNKEIMSMIIGNLPKLIDRCSLELTCSTFYRICNDKSSQITPFNVEEGVQKYIRDGSKVKCCQNTVYLNIPHTSDSVKSSFMKKAKILETYFKRKPKLVIKNLPIEMASDLNSIPTLDNIKTVVFKTNSQPIFSMHLLNSIPSLNPKNIIFEDYGKSSVDIDEEVVEEMKIDIPILVRNVVLMCGRKNSSCLLKCFEKLKKGSLDQLTFGRFFTIGIVKKDQLLMASHLASYFKNVKVIFKNDISGDVNNSIFKLLDKFNMTTTTPVTYEISFYMSSVGNLFSQILAGQFKEKKDLIWPKYSKISVFRVFRKRQNENGKLTDEEVESLGLGLSQMLNLTIFEFQFDLIKTLDEFSVICRGFRKSIRNIKIYGCSKFSLDHLNILSNGVESLENFSIEGISCSAIKLSLIMSSFNTLKGLHVDFSENYFFENIIEDIVTIDETKGGELVKWPNLDLLDIICIIKKSEYDILERMNRNTPRRSGKFLYFKSSKEATPYCESYCPFYRIIIQKSSKNFGIFRSIFSQDTYEFRDETYFGYDPRSHN
uniref:F-box domain-containing protein n=1 Tax=Strongyloides papillosus TaxID=174720 RepID=A0A0N5BGW2_STREA